MTDPASRQPHLPHASRPAATYDDATIDSVSGSSDDAPSTDELQAEINTLANLVREAGPADPYADDSECRRIVRLVEQIGVAPGAAADPVADEPSRPFGELGHYVLQAKLGEGGMGAVYKALHKKLNKCVALKLLPASRLEDQHAVARFEREMLAVGRLSHPNIVAAHDAGEVDGNHYLVMELVDGVDLSTLVRGCGPLPVAEACEAIRRAAEGLQHAHGFGMVHRDIKPSNIMLTYDGQVKVLDMGLALLDEMKGPGARELTSTGQVMGTLDYMAPEQGNNSHTVDIRADVYSLGATLFKLLTGEAPFSGPKYNSPVSKLMALAVETPREMRAVRPDLPAELSDLVARMLAKNPDDRPATPQAVAALLAPFAAGARLSDMGRIVQEKLTGPSEAPSVDTFAHLSSSLTDTHRMAAGQPSFGGPGIRWPVLAGLAGAAAALALLAGVVLLTLQTPHGEVVVELGEGIAVEEAANLKIEVSGNGELKVADAAQGWSIAVREGKYETKLAGAGDRFELQEQQVAVVRGEKTVLRVRLKPLVAVNRPAAEGPSLVPAENPHPAEPGAPKRESTYSSGEPLELAAARKPVEFNVTERLAKVDWQPGEEPAWLRGLSAQPAAIEGLRFQVWPTVRDATKEVAAESGYRSPDVSPRGNYAAIKFTGEDRLTIRETETGRVVGVWRQSDNLSRPVLSRPVWSHDETRMFVTQGSTAYVISREGRLLHQWKMPQEPRSYGWRPGHDEILAVFPNEYRLYAPDGTELLVRPLERATPESSSLHIASTGEHFVLRFSVEPKKCVVIHLESGRVEGEFALYSEVQWLADGERIFARSGGSGSTAAIYTLSGRKLGNVPQTNQVRLDPSGTLALCSDGAIRQLADGKEVARLPEPPFGQVLWQEPEVIRLTSISGSFREYTPAGKLLRERIAVTPPLTNAASWRQNLPLLSAPRARGGQAFLWSREPGKVDGVREIPPTGNMSVNYPFQNPVDGRVALLNTKTVRVVNVDSGETREFQVGGHAHAASWSPNGRLLAIACHAHPGNDSFVDIYQDGEKIRHYPTLVRRDKRPALQWNSTGTHLAFWDYNQKVRIWDCRQEEAEPREVETWVWVNGDNDIRTAPSWSPDGSQLAAFTEESLQFIPIDGGPIRAIPWKKEEAGPIGWTPDGRALLVRGKLFDLEGKLLRTLEPQVPGSNLLWRDEGRGLVAWDAREVHIWDDLDQPAVTLRLPGWKAAVDRLGGPDNGTQWISLAARGVNQQPLDSTGRYLAVVTHEAQSHMSSADAGHVALIDLEEKKHLWTGLGYSDGTQVRLGPGGEYLSGPEQPDDYLVYVVHYGSDRHHVALTQRQFAARIGLDPVRRFLQRVLDYGGALQVRGETGWLREGQVPDATALPDPAEVVGVHLADLPEVGNKLIAELPLLANLETLRLAGTGVDGLGLAPLKQCPKLRVVHLAGLKVGSGVAQSLPPGVEQLDLSRTDIHDVTLIDMAKFPKLKRLDVTGVTLEPAALERFRAARPDCELQGAP